MRWYMCALEVRYRGDQRTFVHPTAYHMPPRATVIASPLTAPAASLHKNAITCATSRGSEVDAHRLTPDRPLPTAAALLRARSPDRRP